MGETVKISVIVPCYNCEQLIDETLESLERQSFKNFEVLCVNDGSTDGTLKKLTTWEEKKSLNLKIIDQPNGGVSSARNAGIHNAVGEWLLFLDSDDCYCESFIERLYSALRENAVDTAYCFYSRTYAEVMERKLPDSLNCVIQNQTEAMSNLLYRMGNVGFYCYLYRREVLIKKKIFFNVDTKYFEDREFNWKYLCHCRSAVMIDAALYWYRINPGSVTQQQKFKWRTDDVEAALRIEKYLKELNCDFYEEVKSYLTARVLCGKLKNRALSSQKKDFKRLVREFDMKTYMKQVSRKDPSGAVRAAARLYLIHPMLFYYVVKLKYKLRGSM
ncbi:MAG: glycosyltransferase family 2 protein [Thermoguttaceae bacterium]|nr:glycosyltransferase family 2 protein [Thermoguttaceae bacterium]